MEISANGLKDLQNRTNRVLYTGYDLETFKLLSATNQLNLVAVNLIPEFLDLGTINPINHIFKVIYRLAGQRRYGLMLNLLSVVFQFMSPLATGIFRKYARYLREIVRKRLIVIDLANASSAIQAIKSSGIDLNVINNWWILPAEIIDAPKYRSINVHPSALPMYRGSVPTLWSLKNGDKYSAVSFMIVEASVDSGKLISQHRFEITPDDNALSVEMKVSEILKKNLLSDIIQYLGGKLSPVPQDKEKASGTAKFFEYLEINWHEETADEILNKVLLYPFLWPLDRCYFSLQASKVHVLSARRVKNDSVVGAGEYKIRGLSLLIGAKDAPLEIPLFNFCFKTLAYFLKNRSGKLI